MPKSLKLYLRSLDPPQSVWFRRGDGSLDSLPALRLIASANLMQVLVPGLASVPYAITECVIDTGAHFSIIAENLWRRFVPGYITPLPFDSQTLPQLRTITIAGGTFPYELGELTVRLEDQERNILLVTVIAKLTQDSGRLAVPFTLGLRGGFLEDRILRAEPDPSATFGQQWMIQEP